MSESEIKRLNENEKLSIIDEIISLYPNLKKDRGLIVNHVLKKVEQPITYILEKITHNEQSYYRDNEGKIFDVNVNLVGIYVRKADGNYLYYFKNELQSDLTEKNNNIKVQVEKIKNSIKEEVQKAKNKKLLK